MRMTPHNAHVLVAEQTIAETESKMTTSRIKGLAEAIKGAIERLDQQAGEAMGDLAQLSDRGHSAITKTRKLIKDGQEAISAIEQAVDALDQPSNGGPPLGNSES